MRLEGRSTGQHRSWGSAAIRDAVQADAPSAKEAQGQLSNLRLENAMRAAGRSGTLHVLLVLGEGRVVEHLVREESCLGVAVHAEATRVARGGVLCVRTGRASSSDLVGLVTAGSSSPSRSTAAALARAGSVDGMSRG